MAGTIPQLRLSNIGKAFGATQALADVSLEVGTGEVLALIGENGAGKSTLMKILSGVHRPDKGSMILAGETFQPTSPQDARRKGVAMIYQELNIARHLSVQENILLGAESSRLGWLNGVASRDRAKDALAQLGHKDLPLERPAGEFTIATQQVIEIARALLTRPKIMIMDEPTSSLTQADSAKLFDVIFRLKASGVSVIYISHFLEECRRVADRYTVIKDGKTVGSGLMPEVTLDRVVAMMTGREVTQLYPRRQSAPGKVVLEARSVVRTPRLKKASLTLRAGEIFGLAGLIGAGRTELLRALFSLDTPESGVVLVNGLPAGASSPRARWKNAIGFLSEDRKEEGLMLNQSLADNVTLPKLRDFGRLGLVDDHRQVSATRRWIGDLQVACAGPNQPAGNLSGGNQQKIALARLLEYPSKIFLLDEPTRGIDIGSKARIYQLIGDLAAAGRSVLFASSYLPELLGLCDTIAVMSRGELRETRAASEWSEASIMAVATGSN